MKTYTIHPELKNLSRKEYQKQWMRLKRGFGGRIHPELEGLTRKEYQRKWIYKKRHLLLTN